MSKNKTKIGIVGCGAIGSEVGLFIVKELKAKACLWALADIDNERAVSLKKKCLGKPKIMAIDRLIKEVDLVIEAACVSCARELLNKVISRGRDIVVLSVGAFIVEPSIINKVNKKGINVYVPSGAICGIDGLGALRLGHVKKVTLTTSKPPKGLKGADYLKKKHINLDGLKKERVVFKGTVKEAIKHFPKNINVAATLMLASGASHVGVVIKADPKLKRNIHRIEVEALDAKVSIVVQNVPSRNNPKTSALAILSTQSLLKKMFSSFKIGG